MNMYSLQYWLGKFDLLAPNWRISGEYDVLSTLTVLAPVVQRLDNAIHWIKLYPVDNAIRFAITYLPDSDLSVG